MRSAILFDFDGTICRTLPHWGRAYQESLRVHGVDLNYHDAVHACFHLSHNEVIEKYKIVHDHSFAELVWETVRFMTEEVDTYPGVAEILRELRAQSVSLGIVTSSRRGHVVPVLQRLKIAQQFEVIVTIDDVSNGKPHAEPINKALASLNISPDLAWMVGDSLSDIRAGHAAGTRTIAFSPGENSYFVDCKILEAAMPTKVAASYAEIFNIVTGQ